MRRPQWNVRGVKQAFQPTPVAQNILAKAERIRPWDGGLNLEDAPDSIDKKKMAGGSDIFFFKNEVRKPFGGTKIGADFPTSVLWLGIWERADGTVLPIAITTTDLYYYVAANTNAWVKVNFAAGTFAAGDPIERFNVQFWLDTMYFASDHNVLREWDGSAATHAATAGGFTARGMFVLNDHLVLLAPRDGGGVLEAQTIRFTQSGADSFSGVGSGAIDFADRDDVIQNGAKLGPNRALIYKTESISELRVTGDAAAPFEQAEIVPGLGLLCPYSLVEWPGGHFLVGSDEQIYNNSGTNLDAIGQDIKSEFFANLSQTRLRDVVATYDRVNGEYMLFRPNAGNTANCKEYFSYNVLKRRWRPGVYEGTTFVASGRTKITGSSTIVVDRYHVFIATSTKRVFRLDEAAAEFDNTPLSFNAQTIDFIAPEDGVELTMKEFRIGYVVDGTAKLTVDVSVDQGATWQNETTVDLGGVHLKTGSVQYAVASLLVTGEQIRVRLRNSNKNEKVRIRSITPVPLIAEESRPEAQQ